MDRRIIIQMTRVAASPPPASHESFQGRAAQLSELMRQNVICKLIFSFSSLFFSLFIAKSKMKFAQKKKKEKKKLQSSTGRQVFFSFFFNRRKVSLDRREVELKSTLMSKLNAQILLLK